jgi:tRNA(Ile2) C34 agmatinyltransferase TiaS
VDVVADYEETLRLRDLLRECENGNPICPWCGSEVVASEGQDEPFFWRCVKEGCYSRNIDEEPLVGDFVLCKKCHSEVEYALRGDKPTWRCKSNARHYQLVKRVHLRLPKMRAILPKSVLGRLSMTFASRLRNSLAELRSSALCLRMVSETNEQLTPMME